ncbi:MULTISPECIES: bifunctional 2-polyprenyl-6-hydroxyphenol methylase/3-demethylubiquinol 3-O-methyltransferase UbiG [unclassified Polynucleobacter]|uniref:class I SAM-dependent methyltransferase n=1 Tax=unclassified Polynucleobacter TaxID=2640945 RepID=UPI0020401511|nr:MULTISPECIES: methyltransferase domain-containing protein [unclassified Polynucleobacter]MEA9604071.1 methyltransferase domain-containing protein [Polynucleobacter sp. JS-JIR-II-c23]QWE03361.1 methyltransferase domain-containing protein [Polynucleobacter sp. JS-JIR-II-b4]
MPSPHDAILNASPWVRRFVPLIPKGGVVLDLACGSGRHSELLASMGHDVLAVDQDVAAVGSVGNPLITPKHLNLEQADWPLIGSEFSAIVVTNYLYRPHLDQLPKMLQQDGVLIYETFALGNEEFGKPSNPNFLLNPGELLTFASRHGLKVVAYEDIYVDQPKPAMVQRLCAVKGELKQRIPLQFQG